MYNRMTQTNPIGRKSDLSSVSDFQGAVVTVSQTEMEKDVGGTIYFRNLNQATRAACQRYTNMQNTPLIAM